MKILNRILLVLLLILLIAALIDINNNSADAEEYTGYKAECIHYEFEYNRFEDNTYCGVTICEDNLEDGILLVSSELDCNIIVTVTYHDVKYMYSVSPDTIYEIIPLPMGAGEYELGVHERISEDRMRLLFTKQYVMSDETLSVFLYPNYMCFWLNDGLLTSLSEMVCADCKSEYDVVDTVINWVSSNVKYDSSYAGQSELDFVSVDEELLRNGGVCMHHTSIVTAMLRSLGIPTKMVWGYIDNEDYHAWNMVYIDGCWKRYDVTAKQGGASRFLIEDDSRYEDYKYY